MERSDSAYQSHEKFSPTEGDCLLMEVILTLQLLEHANGRGHLSLIPQDIGKIEFRSSINVHS